MSVDSAIAADEYGVRFACVRNGALEVVVDAGVVHLIVLETDSLDKCSLKHAGPADIEEVLRDAEGVALPHGATHRNRINRYQIGRPTWRNRIIHTRSHLPPTRAGIHGDEHARRRVLVNGDIDH